MTAPGLPPEEEVEWTTLDWYVPADIKVNLWTLARLSNVSDILEGPYNEIHAYEVLEHFGEQGNVSHFFNTFNNLWDVLVPEGLLIGSSPGGFGKWVWGDPGHTRMISHEQLGFLTKEHYKQLGKTTSSDYRDLLDGHWWEILHSDSEPNKFEFALKKVC